MKAWQQNTHRAVGVSPHVSGPGGCQQYIHTSEVWGRQQRRFQLGHVLGAEAVGGRRLLLRLGAAQVRDLQPRAAAVHTPAACSNTHTPSAAGRAGQGIPWDRAAAVLTAILTGSSFSVPTAMALLGATAQSQPCPKLSSSHKPQSSSPSSLPPCFPKTHPQQYEVSAKKAKCLCFVIFWPGGNSGKKLGFPISFATLCLLLLLLQYSHSKIIFKPSPTETGTFWE